MKEKNLLISGDDLLKLSKKTKNKTVKPNSDISKSQNEIPKARIAKLEIPKKKKKFKFKKFLIFFLIIFIMIGLFAGLSFVRQRQMCSYQGLIDSGKAESVSGESYCLDILNFNNIPQIFLNVFSLNFQNDIKVADNYDPNNFQAKQGPCDINTSTICWLKQLDGEIKQTDDFTNFLLVGVDSRNEEKLTGNTDTIILLSYQHSTGKILTISFPRDLVLFFYNDNGRRVNSRINSIYAIYGDDGARMLQKAISEVTGKEIHYHAFFTFGTFTKVIDSVGTIKVNLDEPFEDAFPVDEMESMGRECARENRASFDYRFCIVNYPEGENEFTSVDAMIYARSRYLSSDFERGIRQQKVIEATLKTVMSDESSLKDKFNTFTALYNELQSNVITNVTLNDISGLFKLVDAVSTNTAKVGADPSFGNYRVIAGGGFDPNYGSYVVKFYDYSYKPFQNYLNQIWEYIAYYTDEPKIKILNASGKSLEEFESINKFVNDDIPYIEIDYSESNNLVKLKGVRIYDFSNSEKIGSVNEIKNTIPEAFLYNAEIDGVKQTEYGEDILIILGAE